jgi:hypothetical protein
MTEFDLGSAMAKFIAFTSLRGPTPPDFPNHAPNPADVGLPTGAITKAAVGAQRGRLPIWAVR